MVLIVITVTSAYVLTITLGGNVSVLGTLDMNNNKITNLAFPTASLDATNKNYIDNNFKFIKTIERIGTEVVVADGFDGIAAANCISIEVATGGESNEITTNGDTVIFLSIPKLTNQTPTD